MSKPSIAGSPHSVKQRPIPGQYTGSDAPAPGKSERDREEAEARRVGHAAGVSAAAGRRILAHRRIKSSGLGPIRTARPEEVLENAAGRQRARQSALVLTPRERGRLRSIRATVARCGTRAVAMRRSRYSGGMVQTTRLLVATKCGNRACVECDERRRRKEAVRVEGRWRRIITLGLPSGAYSCGDAWRRMPSWVGKLTTAMRAAFRSRDEAAIRVARKEARAVQRENAALKPGERKVPVLQYAWCLEPHKSGYPHVHMVTNAGFVGTQWLKRQWSRITRSLIQFAGNQAVRNVSDTCAYLAKYISKTWFTDDIAAVLFRKRQWASTRKDTLKREPEWAQEQKRPGILVAKELENPKMAAKAQEWSPGISKPGVFAIMNRSWSFEQWKDRAPWREAYITAFGNIEVKPCPEYEAILEQRHLERQRSTIAASLSQDLPDFWKTGARKMIQWAQWAAGFAREGDDRRAA